MVDKGGPLLYDFLQRGGDRALHIQNTPTPSATASREIGILIADRVVATLTH